MRVYCPVCKNTVRQKHPLKRLYFRTGANSKWERLIGYGYCKKCRQVYVVDNDK